MNGSSKLSLTTVDLLDPKLDVVFKSLFLRERSLIAPMLEALLGPPVSIASVEVLNPILPKELVADKEAILDLHVRLDDGHQVDVEMQQLWRPGIPERAAYYVARICASQLRAGQPHEELASSTVVFLLGESRLEALEFHEIFTLIGLRTRRRLTHALNVHMVDMHGHALATPDEVMLRRWCRFFVASSRADLLAMAMAMADPVMQRAVQTLEALSADAEMRALAEARQKAASHHPPRRSS